MKVVGSNALLVIHLSAALGRFVDPDQGVVHPSTKSREAYSAPGHLTTTTPSCNHVRSRMHISLQHLVEAMNNKGWDYNKVATELNIPEERIKDIFTGKEKATPVEFNAILGVLRINEQVSQQASKQTTSAC
ncbi:hypothetical protein AG1IA_09837 [Rhizoctonia solani AG-1 IA]|uniref:HTH cro/C1-type domain-containing protein n=1 Tax=Thanatephorus cucumeris (strain AG1-IA) TaxID=983506 RepID=L8WHC7_THACA|nr:hypothetical protein AG1IA_09837 [Rhizoctonia solani AG-1 IA]